MKSILDEIKKIAVSENWHTLPSDSPENKVFKLSDVIEDYAPVVEDDLIVKPAKTKKKGKK